MLSYQSPARTIYNAIAFMRTLPQFNRRYHRNLSNEAEDTSLRSRGRMFTDGCEVAGLENYVIYPIRYTITPVAVVSSQKP